MGEKFFGDERRDAKAAGAVFGVGDGQADFVLSYKTVEVFSDNASTGRGEDVADEKDVHYGFTGRKKRFRRGFPDSIPVIDP